MKKLFFLISLFAMFLVSCQQESVDTKLKGTWKIDKVELVNADDVSKQIKSMYDLSDDETVANTGVLEEKLIERFKDAIVDFKDETVVLGDEELKYSVEPDGTLRIGKDYILTTDMLKENTWDTQMTMENKGLTFKLKMQLTRQQ